MVAEAGFEPHDLRVMSPTSYQAAPLRDMSLYNITYGSTIVRYLFLFYAEVFNR